MIVTTSWDDGHPLDKRLADLLSKYGLSATFYIPRKSQLETLTEPEVHSLSSRFEIGAHTLDHLALTTLTSHQAADQISGSKVWVESITGKSCKMFCPPLGKYAPEHVKMIQASGYIGYRSVEMASIETPRISGGLAEMPTTIQSHPHRNGAYLKNAIRRMRFGALVRTFRLWNRTDWPIRGQWYLDRAAASGGVFHLWGHSWEIDDHDQWKPLEAMFGQLQELITSGRAVPKTNAEVCASVPSDS